VCEVLTVAQRGRSAGEELLELHLALEQRPAREVASVEMQEIEGEIDEFVGSAVIGCGLHRRK
jgi:hypothetical protein